MTETVLVQSTDPVVLISPTEMQTVVSQPHQALVQVKALEPETVLISQEQGPAGPVGPPVIQTKGLTISLPEMNEDIVILYTVEQIQIRRLAAIVEGDAGASLTYTLKYGPSRSGPGTEMKTGGITVSGLSTGTVTDAFDHSIIPANSFVWFQTTAVVGLVEQFHLTVTY